MRVRRVGRWISVVSVLALGAVSALAAVPAGAGKNGPAPNCEVELIEGDATVLQQPDRCAELEVTKVVTGEPAAGTTFAVVVDCVASENGAMSTSWSEAPFGAQQDLPEGLFPPFTETLSFGGEGGTQTVFIASESVCTVSEEPPVGCELVNINPEITNIEDDVVYPVTVTNDCPVEPAPATTVVEVPAAPVVAAPRFTG